MPEPYLRIGKKLEELKYKIQHLKNNSRYADNEWVFEHIYEILELQTEIIEKLIYSQ